jgi:hypothetical protein
MEYLVTWAMTIDADTPRQAAIEAREIQLDPDSRATVFNVRNSDDNGFGVQIDLDESTS